MTNKEACKECGETFEGVFAEGFINGICPECDCYNNAMALEKQWAEELAEYSKRSGQQVDDLNDFYSMCWDREVDRKHLNGLPELIETYERVECELRGEERRKQLSLFMEENENDLPF